MPYPTELLPCPDRLRTLADALEADGDAALARAARRAADEIDAAPAAGLGPPDAEALATT